MSLLPLPSVVILLLCWCQRWVSAANVDVDVDAEYEVVVIVECHDLTSREDCRAYTGCRWRRKTQDCFDMEPIWREYGEMVDIETLPKGVEEFGGVTLRPPTKIEKFSDSDSNESDRIIDATTIVIIPNCITDFVVQTIVSLRSHFDNTTMVQDRTDNLVFSHVVHRVEDKLKRNHPDLHSGLISLMLHNDIWEIMKEPLEGSEDIPEQLFPEIEYLTYNANEKPGFERHRDNGSLITAIFMLTSQADGDFQGGQLIFDFQGEVHLNKGDCVMFRGDQLFHQVKPITKGKRMVLQIELHGNHESEGGGGDLEGEEEDDHEDDDEFEEDDDFLYSL